MGRGDVIVNLVADMVKKEILEWARIPCKDGKEKCHECVDELLKRFEEPSHKTGNLGGKSKWEI